MCCLGMSPRSRSGITSGWLLSHCCSLDRELGLHLCRFGSGLQISDQIEPFKPGAIQAAILPIQKRLSSQGKPEIGWIAAQRVAVKRGRRHAHYACKARVLMVNAGADHRRVAAKLPLPGVVIHYRRGRGAGLVVTRRQGASGDGADAKHGEVIAGDKLSAVGFSRSWRRGCGGRSGPSRKA